MAGEAETVKTARGREVARSRSSFSRLRAFAPSRPSSVLAAAAALFLAAAQSPQRPPPPPPTSWAALIGEYGPDTTNGAMVLENGGKLYVRLRGAGREELRPLGTDRFRMGSATVRFSRRAPGKADAVTIGGATLPRLPLGPESETVFRIAPVRPVPELLKEALAARPPVETGVFRTSELVELTALDSTIKLDIRYAGPDNFLGTPVYSSARAFLQRPAAEALVRAHRRLGALGYGLLIHDGYRPWYVTWMFWEATPAEQHEFVADPASGSRHNRGAAVDLTLYDLKTGNPIEMPGTYDEFSRRSYPEYPGGTSRQRWHRELLRNAMEAEGFAVFSSEWWHFDYQDWRLYPIGNATFEQLAR